MGGGGGQRWWCSEDLIERRISCRRMAECDGQWGNLAENTLHKQLDICRDPCLKRVNNNDMHMIVLQHAISNPKASTHTYICTVLAALTTQWADSEVCNH